MTLLEFTISNLVDIRPIEVLNHAYKHGYPDLADRAAYCSLKQPLKDISRGLTHPGLLAKWVTEDSHHCIWQNTDSVLAGIL